MTLGFLLAVVEDVGGAVCRHLIGFLLLWFLFGVVVELVLEF